MSRTTTPLRVELLEDRCLPSSTIVEAEPNDTVAGANALPLGFDAGEQTAVTVKGDIATLGDRDWFRVDLNAGDVIGATVQGQMGLNPAVRLINSSGTLLIFNDDHGNFGVNLPQESPLPRLSSSNSGDAELYYVISSPGTYFIEVQGAGDGTTGKYRMDLVVARPGLETQPVGAQQVVFVDFNGTTVNMSNFSFVGGSGNRTLSPLAGFLPSWGLAAADEDAVIESILATLQENLIQDIRARGQNPSFDIHILNSRDHADLFGTNPYVARLVIGGTLAEAGVTTPNSPAFAENIDVGNFKFNDEAVVLLDEFSGQTTGPRDLNAIAIKPGLDPRLAKIALVGRTIGNIASHELGHLFGNWHTDRASAMANIMDQGDARGFAFGFPAVGPDGVFGTKDDEDRDFGVDAFGSFGNVEPWVGIQDTLNVVAFGLTTGKGVPAAATSTVTAVVPLLWKTVDVHTKNLPGDLLGTGFTNPIWLDTNAAGWGWFVDPTPHDEGKFTITGNQGGFDHTDYDLMSDVLATGVRETPTAVLDTLFSGM